MINSAREADIWHLLYEDATSILFEHANDH